MGPLFLPPPLAVRGRMTLYDAHAARACLGPPAVAKGLVVVGESCKRQRRWAARRSEAHTQATPPAFPQTDRKQTGEPATLKPRRVLAGVDGTVF